MTNNSPENIELNKNHNESFVDTRELPYDATVQQQINDILEKASEKGGPSKDDLEKIESIKASISVIPKIEAIQEERSSSVDNFEDPREDSEKQIVQEEKHPKKENTKGIKKWLMTLGLFGVMSTAAAKDGNKVEKDTADTGNKIEVGIKSSEVVNDQVKEDWNEYLKWLEEKGMRGKEELNHNNLGYKLFDEYVKTHPGTSLSREILPYIISELEKMREESLQDIANKKAQFASGVDSVNFLRKVEDNKSTGKPEYPGKNVTSTGFPRSKTITIIKKENIDYNKVATKAIDQKLQGKLTDVMSDETKVEVKDNGFVKTKKVNTETKTDVAQNNK